jgi:hypothetical protein
MDKGLAPEEARRLARLEFGNVTPGSGTGTVVRMEERCRSVAEQSALRISPTPP